MWRRHARNLKKFRKQCKVVALPFGMSAISIAR